MQPPRWGDARECCCPLPGGCGQPGRAAPNQPRSAGIHRSQLGQTGLSGRRLARGWFRSGKRPLSPSQGCGCRLGAGSAAAPGCLRVLAVPVLGSVTIFWCRGQLGTRVLLSSLRLPLARCGPQRKPRWDLAGAWAARLREGPVPKPGPRPGHLQAQAAWYIFDYTAAFGCVILVMRFPFVLFIALKGGSLELSHSGCSKKPDVPCWVLLCLVMASLSPPLLLCFHKSVLDISMP